MIEPYSWPFKIDPDCGLTARGLAKVNTKNELNQHYAMRKEIENLFDVATKKPDNWDDLVLQSAKNIRAICNVVNAQKAKCNCGSKRIPMISAPIKDMYCPDCGLRR